MMRRTSRSAVVLMLWLVCVVAASPAVSDFLVIKDVDPWGVARNVQALNDLGYSYDVTTTAGFATFDLVTHSTRVIVVASDQYDSSYDNLFSQLSKLENFVSGGGVLVAHAADRGWYGGDWTGSEWIPGGLAHQIYGNALLSIVDPTHPVLANITDAELDNWNHSSHGHLTNLPVGASIVVGVTGDPTGKPTYVEYMYGAGTVLATDITIEWAGDPNAGSRYAMLKDELAYASTQRTPELPPSALLSLTMLPWGIAYIRGRRRKQS